MPQVVNFLLDFRNNALGFTNPKAMYIALRVWALRAKRNADLDAYIGDDELIVIETESVYGTCLEVGNRFLNESLLLYYKLCSYLKFIDLHAICGADVYLLPDGSGVLSIHVIGGFNKSWQQHPYIQASL